jgi:menaquinone-specific isochorismate synthase
MTIAIAREPGSTSIRHSVHHAIEMAHRSGQPSYVTHVSLFEEPVDPIAFLAASSDVLGAGVLWAQSRTGTVFAGAGMEFEAAESGSNRFQSVARSISGLSSRLVQMSSAPFPILGGFSFSDISVSTGLWHDFPRAKFVVPSVLMQIQGGQTLLRVTAPVDQYSSLDTTERSIHDLWQRAHMWAGQPLELPERIDVLSRHAIPNDHMWKASVDDAVALILQGTIDKVVLAREERILGSDRFSPISVLSRLRELDRTATLFAMQSGASWFLGATPERLLRLNSGHVDVTCLAGSIAAGDSESERQLLADELLSSAKDLEEHEIVVRSTMAALREVCQNVARQRGTPRVVQARSIQHLETPVTAELAESGSVLNLVERLHPTPAVGGYPRTPALEIISRLESIDRGWYAGPFGWTDLAGSGEFAVAIRSALISGRIASAFAGCGIVADSDPDAELEETRLKLRPMLSALGAE